jgi:hypothetical protein
MKLPHLSRQRQTNFALQHRRRTGIVRHETEYRRGEVR